MISREGAGRGYIALGEQREPLDQTDLRNGLGCILNISGRNLLEANRQGPLDRTRQHLGGTG